MKSIVASLVAGALALTLFSGCGAIGRGESVSVESVSMITGVYAGGTADVYAGQVVSGETAEIPKDSDKTVLEVLVEEGDMVREGDVLFTYDTEAMQLSLDKLYLDKENLENTISAAESEIKELESEKSQASSDQQLSYTLQIDSRKADIREAEYNLALKDREIEAMESSMENTEITTPLSGRVMSVGSVDGEDGEAEVSDAFVTVMDISSYRVEGRVNELNRGAVYEGMPVVIRSRVDETQTWSGVIETIDWEKPVSSGNNNMYYGMADEMTTSSQYPFYVELEDNGDLLLGQHVYIEPDQGEGVRGLMLPGWYIVDGSYVWAASSRDKLEKRTVTIGSYDPDLDEYEILSGLSYTDYIAFPDDTLSEGMGVVYYDESSFGSDEGEEEFFYAGEGDDVGTEGYISPAFEMGDDAWEGAVG